MNRELKFRVWNKATKSWLNDDAGTHCWSEYCLNIFTGEVVEIVTSDNKFFSRANEPNFYFDKNTHVKESPYVVQQYTGLKDRHEKEIYEGDILRHEFYPHNKNFVMKWNVLSWKLFDTKEYGDEYIESAVTFDVENDKNRWVVDELEVIGNIMENPELLKA